MIKSIGHNQPTNLKMPRSVLTQDDAKHDLKTGEFRSCHGNKL